MKDLTQYSIEQVEQMARFGSITHDDIVTYLRAWNSGPHFTQAVWCDGAIRNFDPENKGRPYAHLWKEYWVRA